MDINGNLSIGWRRLPNLWVVTKNMPGNHQTFQPATPFKDLVVATQTILAKIFFPKNWGGFIIPQFDDCAYFSDKQWKKKPRLFRVYGGWIPTQLNGELMINHEIRIPMKTNQDDSWKVRKKHQNLHINFAARFRRVFQPYSPNAAGSSGAPPKEVGP